MTDSLSDCFFAFKVWFLFIDNDNIPALTDSNKDFLRIQLTEGKDSSIRFYHFGTTLCSSMKLVGDDHMFGHIHLLKLECNLSPNISFIKVKASKKIQGRYTLV